MNRKIEFGTGSFFHIYSRGTEKRKIFLDNDDHHRFLILLYLCNNTEPVIVRDIFNKGLTFGEIMTMERKETLVDIGAYCLMPNHIHLLIRAKKENGMSQFAQKLFTGYTMYFNKKTERTGRLFESTFKATLAGDDEYLKYLFAYIHLNPVKLIEPQWKESGIKDEITTKDFLQKYTWSSYLSYTDKRHNDSIINKKEFPDYFYEEKSFDDFIKDWLNYVPTKV